MDRDQDAERRNIDPSKCRPTSATRLPRKARAGELKGKRVGGRPSAFSQALADRIVDRIVDGESLRKICRDDDMPAAATVFRWLANPDHEEFREQYRIAREASTDAMFEDMLEIADNSDGDITIGEDGKPKINIELVQRSKLRIWARQWAMAKLKPRKYGDKLGVDVEDRRPMTPEARAARIAELLALGSKKPPAEGS